MSASRLQKPPRPPITQEMLIGLRRWIFAVVGIALVVAIWAHALLAFGDAGTADFFARWMHDAVFVVAGLACVADAVSTPRRRLAAGAMGAGLLLVTIGDVIYSMAPDLDAVPVPSLSDPFWLALYPCAYLALLALTRERVSHTLVATRLDGIVSGFAVASVLACFTMSTAIDSTAGAPFAEQLTNLAYPTADLVLLGAIVSAVALAGWRIDRVWVVLGGAIVAWEAADLIYMLGSDGQIGIVADALIATGAMGMATAVVLRPRAVARPTASTGRGLFVPVAFGMVALGLLAVAVPLHVNGVAIGLAVATLALVLFRMLLALKENQALLGASRVEATTDSLTGLSNRRKLKADLALALQSGEPYTLVLLDLNGFKSYNDSYGHGAGDALLAQLGDTLAEGVRGVGEAYRMGGDEFCVLARHPRDVAAFGALCAHALATRGNGFSITAAYGAVVVPEEAHDATTALVLADTRMYRQKNSSRLPAAHQSAGVLIAVLQERAPGLASHVRTVSELATATATELGMVGDDLDALRHAAALHDIGKMAVPESVLEKPGPLSDSEWDLMRRHTLVGERILAAAPALERSAQLVRSSHERVDGTGYPDGLGGDAIPLGARIILVADAFDAMTSKRSYGRVLSRDDALAELRHCAGTQFDAAVVAAFERVLVDARELAVVPRSA
jgi:diguanylate cyclase (GGDEF)-like protein/putative nucleotidyltransferase with HDIG domain